MEEKEVKEECHFTQNPSFSLSPLGELCGEMLCLRVCLDLRRGP